MLLKKRSVDLDGRQLVEVYSQLRSLRVNNEKAKIILRPNKNMITEPSFVWPFLLDDGWIQGGSRAERSHPGFLFNNRFFGVSLLTSASVDRPKCFDGRKRILELCVAMHQ